MSIEINEKIINLIKERMDEGAKKYGEYIMVDDKREFVQESLEEVLDACVYIASKIIQIKEKVKSNDSQ